MLDKVTFLVVKIETGRGMLRAPLCIWWQSGRNGRHRIGSCRRWTIETRHSYPWEHFPAVLTICLVGKTGWTLG